MRFRLVKEGVNLGNFKSINDIAVHIGCTRQHIYLTRNEGKFSFLRKNYEIIDRLSELS